VLDIPNALFHSPASLMIGLHNLGIPWWSVIPVSALTLRTCFVLPFQVFRRQSVAQIALLQPIIDARMSLYRRSQMVLAPNLTWARQRWSLIIQRYDVSREVGRKFGARGMFLFGVVGLFFLLLVSENIRQICGRKGGILSVFLGPYFPSLGDHEEDEKRTDAERSTREAEASMPRNVFGDVISQLSETVSPTTEGASWFQPSLQTGGFFWCPDLTKRDPSLTLPFLFSASFMASIYFGPRISRQPTSRSATQPDSASKAGAEPKSTGNQMINQISRSLADRPGLTNLQRVMISFAVFMIFPAMQMPSALLLYFISNIGVGALHTRLLSKAIPIRTAPMACKRPVRMNPATERLDLFTNFVAKTKR